MIVHVALPIAAASLPLQAFNVHQVARKQPGRTPAGEALEQLGEAFDKRVDDIKPGHRVKEIVLNQNTPTDDFLTTLRKGDTSKYSSVGRTTEPGVYGININPNADRSYFAHELGHIASDQTDIGNLVRSARGNKGLTRALAAAAILGGGSTAALVDGDDDLGASVAMAYAASAPTIADEFLATKNGLAIMDTAGMRANLGQRARLAGGMLSYLGAPLLLGASTNLVGNQFDDPAQTDGTLMP